MNSVEKTTNDRTESTGRSLAQDLRRRLAKGPANVYDRVQSKTTAAQDVETACNACDVDSAYVQTQALMGVAAVELSV